MSWREEASCVDIDPEVFFPHAGNPRGVATKASKVQALTLCAGCGVTSECLEYALSMPQGQDFGIWGGTTANQRDRMRRAGNQHSAAPIQDEVCTKSLQEAARV